IEIDVSGLKAGESIHVSDIQVPEGVRITEDPEEVVATVTTPTEEAVTEEEVEEEMAEPEVVKKGKKEEAPPEEG
ncbi:MAG TPA: 50S ribosomal protein L25, partial [Nitrospirae bacterium]|nr:50S ribosomal protein L25 [Nitrospirota bacterium]